MPDSNGLKPALRPSIRHFGAISCHYVHDVVSRDTIRLIKADLGYLKQHS